MPEQSGIAGADDIADHLPLGLALAQLIPPAPNRRKSAIDVLYDFGGSTWIAYGASSLLVISHFPSPHSPHESQLGPLFHQAIDQPPCDDPAAVVNCVSWCPSQPSDGVVAAALGTRVWLYSPEPGNDPGSFSWRSYAGMVQAFPVEGIGWTGSGDGLIVAGTEVVLWTRKSVSWEVAWKSSVDVPQSLVSATWYAEGHIATAANLLSPSSDISKKECSPLGREACNSVVVYHNDVKSGIMKVQLFHPQPVTMIHWRPSTATQFQKDVSHSWRDVLLTCCLDGTVRLWSEIDTGRVRKYNKEAHDQKATRQSFHVIAVIEINQCLKGTLGRDIFIEWAIEFSSVICEGKGDSYSLSSLGSEQGQTAKCEWLVSVGPGLSTAFWAIHCLDDTSPLRFPRLTLWKKQDLKDCEGCNSFCSETSYSTNLPVLVKVVASRSCPSGPPVGCSLFQLLSDNRLSWSQIYSPTVNGKEEISLSPSDSEKILSCFTGITLNQYGHAGKIIQLAIHPHSYEVELAVSLDNNGLLLFWSISTLSSGTLGIPLLIHPLWELLGKFSSSALSADVKYLSLRWAPSVLDDKRFLLLGHADGIDCFLIKISQKGEDIVCHKMFTIPFGDHDQGYGPPEFIYTSPFASTCEQSFASNSFLVFALWMTNFRALSWKVVLHSEDPFGSNCRCISDAETVSLSEIGRYTSCFANKIYYAIVNPCASKFPDMQNCNQVISAAVVPPDNSILCGQQYTTSYDSSCDNLFGYQMATGCSDGTLKLWKVSHSKNSEQIFLPWELVGIFTAHEGPVSAVSLSSCSSKIATVSIDGQNCKSTLHIWECIFLIGGGSFLLEDVISLNGPVVALNWLSVGNGQSFLGVCLPNELHVYSAKSPNTVLGKFEKPRQMHAWNCIARSHTYPASQDFLWGPKMIPVLVHEKHFSLFSRWLFKAKKHSVDHSSKDVGKVDRCSEHTMYLEKGVCNTKEPREGGMDKTPYVCTHCFEMSRLQYDSKTLLYSIVDVADKLHGSLQVYHPMALLQNLYSGNWKRAFIVVKHLTGHIKSIESAVTIQESTKSGKSFHHIPEINLSRYFENTTPNLNNDKLQWGENITETSNLQFPNHTFSFMNGETQNNTTTTTFQKTETMEFKNILEKCHCISGIKDTERIQILAIIELLGEICDSSYASAYGSLDEPGRRFWVSVRFQNLLFQRNHGRLAAGEELVANSGLVAWAVQSDCQDNLFSILSAEPSWLEMRNLGVGYWLTNTSQLRMRMEKLARSQYLKNKDPKDCALLYLALNRLQVLSGLFKISKNEKDKPLVGFLSRNFQEEKNKAAALKNAYVLMGRHQLELAIAFFLLGGELSSAVSVCAKNLGDGQLALVICRLIEGNGGPLERHLISNILLPSAIEKGDYWLSSLFEWTLGNYSNSFKNLFDSHLESVTSKSAATCNPATFLDPEVGQYCVLLAAKNCLKNALGDKVAAVLSKFSTVISARALNRCGLPLAALECFSLSNFEAKDQDNLLDVGDHKIFHGILNPFSNGAPNWLSGVVACYLESNSKLNIGMQYISRFLRDHPSWPCKFPSPYGEYVINGEFDTHQDELQMGDCKQDLDVVMSIFREKYSLKMLDLANMILLFSCNEGLFFHGYWLLRDVISKELDINEHSVNFSILNSDLTRLTLKLSKEILHSFARYVVSVNFNETVLQLVHDGSVTAEKDSHHQLFPTGFCLRTLIYLLKSLRPLLNLYNNVILTEGLTLRTSSVLDLLDYCVYFAFAFCQRNIKLLITMIQPIIKSFSSEKTSFEVVAGELKKLLQKILEMLRFENSRGSSLGTFAGSGCRQEQEIESLAFPVSEDEMWHVVDACLWIHLSSFSKHQLNEFSVTERCEVDRNLIDPSNRFSFIIASLLTTALAYISSSFSKQLASFLRRKASKGLPVTALLWINGTYQPDSGYLNKNLNHDFGTLQLRSNQDTESMLRILWDISVSSKEICVSFVNERVASFPYSRQNSPCSWNDMQRSISIGYENGVSPNNKTEGNVSSTNNESGPLHNRKVQDRDGYIEFKRNPSLQSEPTPFQTPIEVIKRSGELLEALCFNSVNEQQAVVVSNRKGLVFLNWKSEQPLRSNAEYIWSDSDWPQDGWAGCESTPIPTFVSPGIGLGSKKGLHLGLGGATIGIGSLARPGRDLTGGGAFGIPGYAGIGASGLGWGEQEGFEEFIDPLPTAESIRSRALSSHPLRPFFLVGSSNTHVYLWEFDKDRATSTYGVLPAANVPPPYALASISSVQVDHCGQRFATAALDGTVCTWQLEVGGRNNVRPTESALCFNNHATDVAYVASSGSILAAAGYSTNGVNVIVWDTLAPPATSQASLVCHEGGARSISVFDNDIGSGSISPLIVTGGKGGDVGLHDFRFITTGRTKRHRHSSEQDFKSMHETSKYGENTDGMIWYIPKAHLGSVTKIATIPNTSLFLTGSKDGDVKLWDARRSKLVFHWQKMHDRHTFLQPNSRGFGGVVRAAVTDIQVFSGGFLTCGADGSAKLVKLKV